MSTGFNVSEPVTELFARTNIGGYALHVAATLADGRYVEDFAIPECELERLADKLRLGFADADIKELLTARAHELTLKQLVTILHFLRTLWSIGEDKVEVVDFELSIDPIDQEFLANYDPPQ